MAATCLINQVPSRFSENKAPTIFHSSFFFSTFIDLVTSCLGFLLYGALMLIISSSYLVVNFGQMC